MDIEEYSERQRRDRLSTLSRHAQREASALVTGEVIATGDSPLISIRVGPPIQATNLGGLLKAGDVVLAQSDGLNYYVRGKQSV